MNWYVKVISQYADFDGRARRKEYWMFALFNFLIMMIPYSIFFSALFIYDGEPLSLLGSISMGFMGLYGLFVVIPSLAVSIRRLHDTGRSGWNLLWGLVPGVGGLIVFYFYVSDSESGTNAYGPNPKEEGEDIGLYQD